MDSRHVKIGTVLLLIASVVCWWFFYYTKTPAYSLNIIKESIEQHDLKTFQKHVNLDSIVSNAIDDNIASEKGKNEYSPFINGLLQIAKSNLIEQEKKGVYTYIETGTNTDKEHNSLLSFLSEKEFVDIGEIHKDGKLASVEIIANDKYLGGVEFTFIINMRELADGTWEVTKLSNFNEYKNTVKEIQKQQLKEYTDTIDSLSEEMEYEKELCLTVREMGSSSSVEEKIEKLKNAIRIQSKFNEAVADIYIPSGAKEYAATRQMQEKYKYDASIYLLRVQAGEQLTPNEIKKYYEAKNNLEEAKEKLTNIRKQAGLSYYEGKSSYEERCLKYE